MTLQTATSNVLATYEQAIKEEHKQKRATPAPGEPDTRMRAIGPETGQLLTILAQSLATPTILELGTSYGYSTIWLAEAARLTGGRVVTMEYYDYKSEFAHQMAQEAGLAAYIDFQVGDALALMADLPTPVDFVFLDLWKDLYTPCLEVFYPKLAPGAIITADNIVRPGNEHVKHYQREIRGKAGITSVLLPVGTGVEVSRYEPD